jgi:exodeoxyribonuclease V beta subunit
VLSERLRLTYVALTRARHQCILYWGRFKDAAGSALGYLLSPDPGDDPMQTLSALAEGWAKGNANLQDRLQAVLQDLQAKHPDEISWDTWDPDVASPRGKRWTPEPSDAPAVTAAEWQREVPLDRFWRWGSFTALSRNSHVIRPVRGGADETPSLDGESVLVTPPVASRRIRLTKAVLPAGATPGLCVHAIFEGLDFATAGRDDVLAAATKARQRYGAGSVHDVPLLAEALLHVLETPLAGTGFALREVPQRDCLPEWPFLLPVADPDRWETGLHTQALAEAFRQHPGGAVPAVYADRLDDLRFAPLRGFLTGTMDLVFRYAGRWYLVDYKTNYLGDQVSDYDQASLAESMMSHQYPLQYHLYLVALVRFLRLRIPDFRYDRDFGGVLYLYVRGMGVDGQQPAAGIWLDHPPEARVLALDAALQHAGGAR